MHVNVMYEYDPPFKHNEPSKDLMMSEVAA